MTDTPQFEFKMRATEKDPTGYYYPDWDRCQRITVQADNRQEAMELADKVLGPTPTRGRYWIFHFDGIAPVRAEATR